MGQMRRRGTSIKAKLRSVIVLTSAIVLLITASAFVTYEVISFRQTLVRNTAVVARVIAENSSAALAFGDVSAANGVLSALRAEPDILEAVLTDAEERYFAHYPASTRITDIRMETVIGPRYRFEKGALLYMQPVMQGESRFGTLYVRSSLRPLTVRLELYGVILALVMAGSLFIAFLLSTALQRRISEPILALANTAQVVATRNDYSVRAKKLSDDEVGMLTDAFNKMLEEIQRSGRELRESEEKFRGMIETANEGIWILDEHGRVSFVNDQMANLLGCTKDQIIGKEKGHFVFPEDQSAVEELFKRRREGISEQLDVRFRRKDGTELWAIMAARPLLTPEGKFQGVLDMFADVTDRRRAEEKLRVAHAQIREHAANLEKTVTERTAKLRETIGELEAFSYSISHDMRAPLRAMHRYAEILLQDAAPKLSADEVAYIHQIINGAKRLDRLIQDVLTYSRVSRSEMQMQRTNLDKLITDIVEQYPQLQADKADIEIQRPLLPVMGQEASLSQCFSNLLVNAVKFVAPGVRARVRIWTEPVGDNVLVRVQDNGIGIAPADQQRIFGMFSRVHSEKVYEGTGIGLAIVRKAVERMGGRVGVDSEVGKGSTFWIELQRGDQA